MPKTPTPIQQLSDRTEIEIVLTGDAKLSKQMKALSPKARAFVLALIELGGATGEMWRAAEMAGYAGGKDSLAVAASRLAADERVQAALVEEARRICKSMSIEATAGLGELMRNRAVPAGVRLSAMTRILTMAGMDPAQQHLHLHEVDVSITMGDKVAEVKKLSQELGLDPQKLLGRAGIIDAEFSEVPTEGSTQGLEDLL